MAKVRPNALTRLTLAFGLALIAGSVSAQEIAKDQAAQETDRGICLWQTWGARPLSSDVPDTSRLATINRYPESALLPGLPAHGDRTGGLEDSPEGDVLHPCLFARRSFPLLKTEWADAREMSLYLTLEVRGTSTTEPASSQNNDAGNDAANEAELAKELQNPVANLISVPLQSNMDFRIGPKDALRYTLNVQPVIPFSLNDNWNLITRTIVPVIYAEPPAAGAEYHSGIGDIVQSFFFSPTQPVGGWIVGAGPVFLWPTATDDALGGKKWGAGPTAVVLRQANGWTYGALANHIWSYGTDDSSRQEVNATFLQPFISYITKTYTTVGLNTESTYDWTNSQWTVPINLTVSQLLKIGKLPIQFTVGGRYYAARPPGGPDWGIRFAVTFLFPK